MRGRYHRMALTIASGASIACSDAAVEQVTAPAAAKPAVPVTAQYPSVWDYEHEGIPNTVGITIGIDSRFENDYGTFVAEAKVRFTWANEVSATLKAWLLDPKGNTVNSGTSSGDWYRVALPVASGDTTLVVRLSTNNVRCGLLGKTEGSARAAQVALDASLVTVRLFSQSVGPTSGKDVLQPACPPPPGCETAAAGRLISHPGGFLASANTSTNCDGSTPISGGGGGAPAPPAGGDDEYEVCYTIWRELWIWDWLANRYYFQSEWIVGVICYIVTNVT